MSSVSKRPKKEKITYIDDGRTIADMSNVSGGMGWKKSSSSSRFRDIWRTYWNAVKMMFLPMLVVIGFLIVAFLIMALIFWLL